MEKEDFKEKDICMIIPTYNRSEDIDISLRELIKNKNIPGRVGRVLKDKGVEILTGTTPLIITKIRFNGKDYLAYDIVNSFDMILK